MRPSALLIGSLGDRAELMKPIMVGDWNEFHIIAHGVSSRTSSPAM